jgi:uncharacterized protein (TIRG00374 family)
LPLLLVLLRRPEVRRRLVDRAARAPMLARHRVGIDDSLAAFGLLTRPAVTAGTLTLSVLAWCAECVGLWLVCRGLGFPIAPPEAAFAYAAGTLVGSLTFLPGGLGGTEATIIWLLGTLGMPAHQGAAAALLIRLFTLWLAVLIGLGFFFAARELFTGDEDAATRP